MKIQDITDITVSVRAENAVTIQWAAEGLRYHMNVLRDTLQVTEGFMSRGKKVIMVNPPKGVDYGKPGWFKTRKLDADAASNARVVKHVIDYARTNDLVEGAFRDDSLNKQREEAARKAALIGVVMKVLGAEGYDVSGMNYDQAVRILDGIRKI